MTPSPMMPAPETLLTVMSGLQPPAGGDEAAASGVVSKTAGSRVSKRVDAFVDDEGDAFAAAPAGR